MRPFLTLLVILFAAFVILPFSLLMYSRTRVDSPPIAEIWSATDLNPLIRSDAEIIGNWSGKNESLMLSANKSFKYKTPAQVVSGTWAREDFNLYLKDNSGSCCNNMRLITFHNQYFILTDPPNFGEVEGHDWLITAMDSALQNRDASPASTPIKDCPAKSKICNPYDTPENRATFNKKNTLDAPAKKP